MFTNGSSMVIETAACAREEVSPQILDSGDLRSRQRLCFRGIVGLSVRRPEPGHLSGVHPDGESQCG